MSTSSFEAKVTDVIAGLVPWLAPIPSAVLVANATQAHLGWSQPVAIVAGLIIEGLGLTSTSTALTLWDWNARRPANEPKAPFWLSGLMVAVYLISTIGLTVVLDLNTALVHVAPAVFPVLALVMGILFYSIFTLAVPFMDGIETLIEIKSHHPNLEVIMLTGQASLEDAVKCLKYGAADYLMKPTDIEEIIQKAEDAFKKEVCQ